MIAELSPPVYPPIARTAYISGDVNLLLHVNEDEIVDSAAVVSGPEMLRPAALESAQKSKFKCAGCGEAGGSYSLIYSFQLAETGACASNAPPGLTAKLKYNTLPTSFNRETT